MSATSTLLRIARRPTRSPRRVLSVKRLAYTGRSARARARRPLVLRKPGSTSKNSSSEAVTALPASRLPEKRAETMLRDRPSASAMWICLWGFPSGARRVSRRKASRSVKPGFSRSSGTGSPRRRARTTSSGMPVRWATASSSRSSWAIPVEGSRPLIAVISAARSSGGGSAPFMRGGLQRKGGADGCRLAARRLRVTIACRGRSRPRPRSSQLLTPLSPCSKIGRRASPLGDFTSDRVRQCAGRPCDPGSRATPGRGRGHR